MEDNKFGLLLREFRIRAGLSQRALAKKAGVNTSYVSRLESGDRKVASRDIMILLSRILELSHRETDLWFITAGYISPRLQGLANAGISRLIEDIGIESFNEDSKY